MPSHSMHDVIIIGGGLAGCAAATHLAERGHRVLLLEKGTYPQHKLCGEFLSTEVEAALDRLGLVPAFHNAGAHPIRRVQITTGRGAAFHSPLPGTAWGLSRYRLDAMLVQRAEEAGADVRTRVRVQAVTGTLDTGFTVEARGEAFEGRVVLGAYGKRDVLDRKLERPFLNEDAPYVAFKAHYRGARLPHTIEMHAFNGGYCGLSHVEDDLVNVCWIGREDRLRAAGGDPEVMIKQGMARNETLSRRMAALTRVSDSFKAVSQVHLAPKSPFDHDVCMIGDTAGMIAPFCGDGMAMALTSAELATPLVTDFLAGTRTAADFKAAYHRDWQRAFGTRMRLGRWIHRTSFRPFVASFVVRACHLAPPVGRWLIRATRG